MTEPDERISEARRIRVIEGILAAHGSEDWEFDRITRLARATLRVPVCLVSLVTSDRQVFVGASGLPDELEATREAPLSHSICQHAVARRSMLVVGDTLADPVIREVLSVLKYGIRAYLGCPLITRDGTVLGSLCVIDQKPREWTLDEIDLIRDFAALVVEKVDGKMMEERHRSAFDVMIHDLKSPLSGLLMASSLLNEQSADFPERALPLLEAVSEEGGKALRLVDMLARENHMETVDVCQETEPVLRRVIDRLEATAGSKSIGIRTHLSSCDPLATSPWVIEQVLENLLENAIKYSPPGSTIHVSSETSGRVGHLSVKDEGPGFSENDRRLMFRRYTRLSAMPTGDEPSTGLGLSIVKRLIDQHGGRIDLVSAIGSGAEFRVTFPVIRDGR
jgi:signal transduction histidine kinase